MVTFVTPPTLIPSGPLHTSGNQIVDQNGNPIRITSIGWNGGNSISASSLEGEAVTGYKNHIDNMIRLGFNSARILTCARGVLNNYALLAHYDNLLTYASSVGFRFIIDIHNAEGTDSGNWGVQPPNGIWYDKGGASNGTDGGGTTGTITDADFVTAWQTLATRWKNQASILAYDIQNEPQAAGHTSPGSTWGGLTTGSGIVGVVNSNQDIRYMYQRVGNAIHAIDPRPLIICEAPIDYHCYHPAGDLTGVKNWPVTLNQPNKVVYSTHEYGQYVSNYSGQSYINELMQSWGWMIAQNVAPMFIGEMGGNMNGSNGYSAAQMSDWGNTFIPFLNGQWPNTFTFSGNQQGIGTDWWVWTNGDYGEQDFTMMTAWTNQSIVPQNKPFMSQLEPFSVSTTTKQQIFGPITGATSGSWVPVDIPFNGIYNGKFHFEYLLPYNYDPSKYIYPILIYEHENTEGNQWYFYNQSIVYQFEIDQAFNSTSDGIAFRNRYPCIVLVPYCDQTDNTGGTGLNFGGYNDDGTGVNERAVIAMIQYMQQNFSVDSKRIYVTGDSLGGHGSIALMLDYNNINGPQGKVMTAGLSFSGQIYRASNPANDPNVQARMKNVPLFCVSGSQDTTSPPEAYNRPMWRAYAGNSNYPGPMGAQAGSSSYRYLEDQNLGHDTWTTYRHIGSGQGQQLYDWLFAQQSSGGTVTPPPPPSPDGTVILLGSSSTFIDNNGNQWGIVNTNGGQVTLNGVTDNNTSNAILIEWLNGKIWHENTSNNWYYKNSSSDTAWTGPVPNPNPQTIQTISANAIPTVVGNTTPFTVSGVLTGYISPPTLNYADDNGTYKAFPTGNTITNVRFSFTHPNMTIGNHNIRIRDTANTAVTSGNVTYTVIDFPPKSIVINPIGTIRANTPFAVSGQLSGYSVAPSLKYSDDGSVTNTTITSTITATSFNFQHPAIIAGNHNIRIFDSSNTAVMNTITYTANNINVSPNNSYILAGNTSALIDSNGNQWTITSGGQVANNGIIDQSTANVIELAYVNNSIWQENASNLWWQWLNNSWQPTMGTSTSPLPAGPVTKVITVNIATGSVSGTPFTVSGTLSGYTTTPTLQYSDDNNALVNLPTGSSVSTTNFSFLHPSMSAGTHTLKITDSNVSSTISYTLSTASGGVTRYYADHPGGSGSAWNTPFGDGAIWGNDTDADTIDARQGGIINPPDNYGCAVWVGKASDGQYTFTTTQNASQRDPGLSATMHAPTGAFTPGPYPGDNPFCLIDPVNQPGKTFTFGNLQIQNLQPGQGPFQAGVAEWNDATSDSFAEDQETGNYGYDVFPGVIRLYDIDPNQNPNFPKIQHGLRYSTDAIYLKSNDIGDGFTLKPDSWPQKLQDFQGPGAPSFNIYKGNLKAGTTLGIPINTPMPSGLTQGGQMLWWNAQHYPWFFRDQAGGGMHLSVDQACEGTSILDGMRQDLQTIVQYLRPLRNQHIGGQSFSSSPKNGPGNRVDSGPPPLTGTVVPPTHVININTPTNVVSNTLFTVSGTLSGYTSAPILTYSDDGGGMLALPPGSTVTANSFSFIHPVILTTGNHNITVSDGPTNSSTTYTVSPPSQSGGGGSGGGNIIKTFLISPLTGSGSYQFPSNWNSLNNQIEGIGGGGGGTNNAISNGGGGGAYSKIVNYNALPNSSTSFQVGVAGAGGDVNLNPAGAGGDTIFGNNVLVAKGGKGATTAGGGAGGSAASSIGTTKYDGGGAQSTPSGFSGQGGGGAAGPNGPGKAGGQAGSYPSGGGGGGGGNGGGSAGVSPGSSQTGGNGGNNSFGQGGGTGGNNGAGSTGTNGGGGGGGFSPISDPGAINIGGGNGGDGTDFDSSHGSGGGGGGGGAFDGSSSATGAAGSGGLYGGGAGGDGYNTTANSGKSGAPGIIVVTSIPAATGLGWVDVQIFSIFLG